MTSAQRIFRSSPPHHRVGHREMSWLEPFHTGQASGGSDRSVSSTIVRSGSAANGAYRNGMLNASPSSSPVPWYEAMVGTSSTYVSPSRSRFGSYESATFRHRLMISCVSGRFAL
jgi:hypothetical protein